MITSHLDAGYPAIAVATADDSPLLHAVHSVRETAVYSASQSIVSVSGDTIQPQATWHDAFAWPSQARDRVIVVRDSQHVISNAPVYRSLCDQLCRLKSQGSAVVMVAPSWQNLPEELRHVVPVINWGLPTRDELRKPLDIVGQSADVELNGNTDVLLDCAAGLTIDEAESAFALSVVETGGLDPVVVAREKMRAIATTGFLSVAAPQPVESIGGLGQLKTYLADEVKPNCRDPQLAVRGVLLAGVPGTGKSLASKACGSVLDWPVVRLDVAACKGSLVGQSESNIRRATEIAEAISPCVLWIDEIEKAVGGYRSSASTDGGTTLGMVGHLLTWLQEHTSAIFTIATCNDYQALPPELTRAGRFDERFVVDLPTQSERVAIANVHLFRLGCDNGFAELIAEKTNRWTGAEIEQLVRSAARLSQRDLTAEVIDQVARTIKPIAQTRAAEIDQFRNWAKQSLRPANDVERQLSRVERRVRANENN